MDRRVTRPPSRARTHHRGSSTASPRSYLGLPPAGSRTSPARVRAARREGSRAAGSAARSRARCTGPAGGGAGDDAGAGGRPARPTGPGEHPPAGGDVGGEDAGTRARFGVTGGAGGRGRSASRPCPPDVDRPGRGIVPRGRSGTAGPVVRTRRTAGPVVRRDRGIPVRPRRTTVVLSCPTGPDTVRRGTPFPDRTSSPAAGRNRGRPSPVGPERRSGGTPRVGPPMGGARSATGAPAGQAATVTRAGSTSVQDEPRSAERVTASSTSWTCNASANEGSGSVPVATASTKSRIWWVKECS